MTLVAVGAGRAIVGGGDVVMKWLLFMPDMGI